MSTWRNAPPLTNSQRTELREGLLVEYAPGLVVPADLAATACLRGALLAPLLPAGYTAVTLTALWIHTGWWPTARMRQLYAAHPARTKPPASHRRTIPRAFTSEAGGTRLTTPARTAADLLIMEQADVAVEGILLLLGGQLSIGELQEQLSLEKGRRSLPFAREMAKALNEYLAWRTRALTRRIATDR
ncbi:hypothetical protein VR010_11935 [Actinomycetaceae bacterium L2_0104]